MGGGGGRGRGYGLVSLSIRVNETTKFNLIPTTFKAVYLKFFFILESIVDCSKYNILYKDKDVLT